jgi:putative ATPase
MSADTDESGEPALFDPPGGSVPAGSRPPPPSSAGSLATTGHASTPLAVRMRPVSLDELVGQQQLRAEGSPLRQLVESDRAMSVLLWGPPGSGKTTIAGILSHSTQRRFVEVSATSAGVREVRAVIEDARKELGRSGTETVLFVDEVHRFSKAQQDALLPGVENRWVTLVAATTENPFFSVISPLLSRSLLLTLEPLTDEDVNEVVTRAVADPRGLGGSHELEPEALSTLVRLAGGDARRALSYLEAAADAANARGRSAIDVDTLEAAVDRAAVRYDRDGDQHYDVISAFIKSIRGSDVDAGLHYLARMLEAGEDPRFVARRLMILASEDVGMADPQALPLAVAAAQTVQLVGLPEAALNLAHAVTYLALAPKSNAVTVAIGEAVADVRAGRIGGVPPALRDAHYGSANKIGHGQGYSYAHDDPRGVVRQDYPPAPVAARRYYRPKQIGAERDAGARWERLRAIIRGEGRAGDDQPT